MRRSEGMSPVARLDRAVVLSAIDRQRHVGWPDFHPEDYCHRCGRRNIGWCVDSELWNLAVGDQASIVCPQCFVEFHEQATGLHCTWRLVIEVGSSLDVEATAAASGIAAIEGGGDE